MNVIEISSIISLVWLFSKVGMKRGMTTHFTKYALL